MYKKQKICTHIEVYVHKQEPVIEKEIYGLFKPLYIP